MGESFASLLRTFRKGRGFTQETLAERAGIGVRTIQALEDGSHLPQQRTLESLADALRLEAEERRAFERAGLPAPRLRRPDVRAIPNSPTLAQAPRGAAHNLGVELTSFIGREQEIADLRVRLAPDAAHPRLVTLTGSGGCGKTRLARRVARDVAESYAHGAWFIDLAPLSNPIAIPPTIVAALGLPEQPGMPAEVALVTHLQDRQVLLVLDNCEHLLDGVAHIATLLLEACPHLRILATSRERLRVGGEVAIRIPSLATPPLGRDGAVHEDHPGDLERFDAVRLFLERTRDLDPGFRLTPEKALAVVQICSRLDGIPLAIELAAARVPTLGVAEIAKRLDDRFRLFTAGNRTALPRQQTLRASLEWSYRLLTESEQILLRRLAVFAGDFPLDAVERVTSPARPETSSTLTQEEVLPTLASLADKSLVHVDEKDGELRYLLLETVCQYAWEKLEDAGEDQVIRDAHLTWCTKLAADSEAPNHRPSRNEAFNRLDREFNNLRAALEWCKADPARREAGLILAGTLYVFWRQRGHLRDGLRYLRELLALSGPSDTGQGRSNALLTLGHLELMAGNATVAQEYLREAVSRLEGNGYSFQLGLALTQLALSKSFLGEVDEAVLRWNDLVHRAHDASHLEVEASACYFLGIFAAERGEFTGATSLLEKSRELRAGNENAIAFSTFELGRTAFLAGDPGAALRLMRESLSLWQQFGDPMGIAIALDGLSWVAVAREQMHKATHLAAAAASRRKITGATILPAHTRLNQATLERTRAQLGDEAWNHAWAEGQAMSDDDVIAYATADPAV